MKTLRRSCAAAIPTLLMSVSVFAGQLQCPGVASGGQTATNIATSVILTIVNLSN